MIATTLDVRIVELEPMRVAATLGFGPSPEAEAWAKLLRWAEEQGLLQGAQAHRFFGFNNPDPSPGSPNYGYEQWMTVDPQAQPCDDVEIKDVAGGRYAVTRCTLDEIGPAWQALVHWIEESQWHMGAGQCLEECITSPLNGGLDASAGATVMDLYLPITS